MEQSSIVDGYKKAMDEWGSIAMAPLLFAPADVERYAPKTGANPLGLPKHPFELTEVPKIDGSDKFTMDNFYTWQGASNGQVLTTVRQQLKVAAEGQFNADAVKAVTEQAKMDVFQQNLASAREGNSAQQVLATEQAGTAQATLDSAQKEVDEATTAATAARTLQTTAAVNFIKADGGVDLVKLRQSAAAKELAQAKALLELPGQDAEQVAAAARRVATAEQDVADAGAALTLAEKLKLEAQAQEKQAKEDMATAEKQRKDAVAARDKAKGELASAQKAVVTATHAPITFPSGSHPTGQTDALAMTQPTMGNDTTLSMVGNKPAGSSQAGQPLLPGVMGDGTGAFAPMARINAAAAALTVKNILSFMGNPALAAQFADKRLLFGVTTLSVNPGWRTRKGFKGVIDARVKVEEQAAQHQTIREMLNCADYPVGLRKIIADSYPGAQTEAQRQFFKGKTALLEAECKKYTRTAKARLDVQVHAVSPMVDAQNLDLASSVARQNELALFFAAQLTQLGMGGAGSLFTSWSDLQRKDVATRTSVATANSFSLGDHFGFEIGTRLHGVDEADAQSRDSAQILERQTFPVLLILGMPQDEARPRLEMAGSAPDGSLRVKVCEPKLSTDFSMRWSHKDHNFWTKLNWRVEREPSDSYREALAQAKKRDELNPQLGRTQEFQEYHARQDILTRHPDTKFHPYPYMEQVIETQQNQSREFGAMAKALEGENYSQTLPAAWMLDNPPGPAVLFDPDVEVAPAHLEFTPESSKTTPLKFASQASQRTLLISAKAGFTGIEALDETQVSVVGGGLELVPGRVQRTQDTLRLELRPTPNAPASGTVQILLGYRPLPRGEMTTALRRAPVLSNDIHFAVLNQETPAITGPVRAQLEFKDIYASGTETVTGWTHKAVSLVLTGTRLDLLSPEGAKVRGVGVGPGTSTPTVARQGREALLVTFDLHSPQGSGEFVLDLAWADPAGGTTARKVSSHAVKFTFSDATPELAPTEPAQPQARLVEAQYDAVKKTMGAQVKLVLPGSGLKQVTAAEVSGFFDGTATVESHEKALVVVVSLTGVRGQNLPTPTPPSADEDAKKAQEREAADAKRLEAFLAEKPVLATEDLYLTFAHGSKLLTTQAIPLTLMTNPAVEKKKIEEAAKAKADKDKNKTAGAEPGAVTSSVAGTLTVTPKPGG